MAHKSVTSQVYGHLDFIAKDEHQWRVWKNKEEAGIELHAMLDVVMHATPRVLRRYVRENKLVNPLRWYYRRLVHAINLIRDLKPLYWSSEHVLQAKYMGATLHGICDMVLENRDYVYMIEWKTSDRRDKLYNYRKQVNYYANMYSCIYRPTKPIKCIVVCLTDNPQTYHCEMTVLDDMTPDLYMGRGLMDTMTSIPDAECLMSLV